MLEQQIGFLLRRAYHRNMGIWQSHGIDKQVTAVQISALVALQNRGPCSLSDLGRSACMDPATTRGVVERLEERGLMATWDDPGDRRRVIAGLTPAGEDVVADMAESFEAITEETLRPLSLVERVALTMLLQKIAYVEE